MQKNKICHVALTHNRYDKRILMRECMSLAQAMYDVTLLVADGKPNEIKNGVKIKSVDISTGSWWLGPGEWMVDGRKVKSKNISIFHRLDREVNTTKRIFNDAIATEADIFHIHEPILLPLGIKLKSIGKKVIFDCHEDYPAQIRANRSIPYLLRGLCSSFYKRRETKAVKQFDAVIVPCTFSNGINIFEGRCNRFEIITNAPKLEDFYDRSNNQQRYYNSLKPRVCYTGGLTVERGITHIVKAAHKAGVTLSLAGIYAPTGYREQLEKMSEYLCVDYRGYLNHDELLELYKESHVGLSTLLRVGQYNTEDNLPVKVYEYMSMGLPVILTRYSYSEKIMEKYNFGILVDPENIDEISNAIGYLINNPNKAKEMGENGRRVIREELNWRVEEKKLIKFYKDIVD